MTDYGLATYANGQYGPELASCPFCGGAPYYVQGSFPSGDYKVQVQCTRCDAQTAAEATSDREHAYVLAARRWNRRADGPDDTEDNSDSEQ